MYVDHSPKGRRGEEGRYWQSFGGRINPGRNYNIFGMIAGVRSNDEPMFPVRGEPENMSFLAAWDAYLYVTDGDEGEGSCTRKNAESWITAGYATGVYDTSGKLTKVSHPDWHSQTWLTSEEFGQLLDSARKKHVGFGIQWDALRAAMKALEDGGDNDVRVVIWFDN